MATSSLMTDVNFYPGIGRLSLPATSLAAVFGIFFTLLLAFINVY